MRKKRNCQIMLTILTGIIIAVILFLIAYLGIGKYNENYNYVIKFYDQDTLIQEVVHKKNERITQEEIEKANMQISNIDNKYHLSWSYSKSIYKKVDFENLNYNADVYLFKLLNKFKVEVIETGMFDYEIIKDGPTIKGSNAAISIQPKKDGKRYQPVVMANNQPLELAKDGLYYINNITEDIEIKVVLKEIITLALKEDIVYTYNGEKQYAEYVVYDSEGNVIQDENINISYKLNNSLSNAMINAGQYEVKLHYSGNKYFAEDTKCSVVMHKALSTIGLVNNKFKYDGTTQSLTIDDINTNSDGKIEFTNNTFNEIGKYDVLVTVAETENYLELNTKLEVEVIKGRPTIVKSPTTLEAMPNQKLSSVALIDGKANVNGTFTWVNPNQKLIEGMNSYFAYFIPNDEAHYSRVIVSVQVYTLTDQELLQRIKIDREETMQLLDLIFNDEVKNLDKLIIKAERYSSNITWFSSSTALKIDKNGSVTITNIPGKYTINLVGLMTLGDAAEYINYTITLVVESKNEVETKEPQSLTTNDNNNQQIENHINNSNQVIENIEYEEIIDYQIYEIYNQNEKKCLEKILQDKNSLVEINTNNRKMININKIILWIIISDSNPKYHLVT